MLLIFLNKICKPLKYNLREERFPPDFRSEVSECVLNFDAFIYIMIRLDFCVTVDCPSDQ